MRRLTPLILFSLLMASCTGNQQATAPPGAAQSTPHPRLTPTNSEPIKADHYKITLSYLTNGVAANDEYKGKLVDVSGDAGTISEEGGEIFVMFNWGEGSPPVVTCYFDPSERASVARLHSGQKVTLRCIGAGADRSKVEFRQCKVAS